jgi:hypothetical protein
MIESRIGDRAQQTRCFFQNFSRCVTNKKHRGTLQFSSPGSRYVMFFHFSISVVLRGKKRKKNSVFLPFPVDGGSCFAIKLFT